MKKNNKGFTLIEMSIVLMVMGAMTMGFLTVSKGAIDLSRQVETKDKIAKINNALNSYFAQYGKFPEPDAMMSGANKTVGNFILGAIPASILGLSDSLIYDGWKYNFVYIVSKQALKSDNIDLTKDNSDILIDGKYIYAIISNGRDKYCGIPYSKSDKINNSIRCKGKTNSPNSYYYYSNTISLITVPYRENDTNFVSDIVVAESLKNLIYETNYKPNCILKNIELSNYCEGENYNFSNITWILDSSNNKYHIMKYGDMVYSDPTILKVRSDDNCFSVRTINGSDTVLTKDVCLNYDNVYNCVLSCNENGLIKSKVIKQFGYYKEK